MRMASRFVYRYNSKYKIANVKRAVKPAAQIMIAATIGNAGWSTSRVTIGFHLYRDAAPGEQMRQEQHGCDHQQ